MCSFYKQNLETKTTPNIQFQIFELALHSEKEFGINMVLQEFHAYCFFPHEEFLGKVNI